MAVARSGIKIVKNSGNVEFFDPNVITNECIEAGIEFFTAAEVALEVSKVIYDGISTKEIQEAALEILYKKYPEVAERYKRFHSMQVRTSRNTIEPFDRKKIAASLVKETGLPREIGDTIAKESEAELRRLKLDFISSPLIREIVNVKLLEHGFEEARGKYTRLGMPIYDAANLIENYQDDPASLHHLVAGSIFKEYTLLKVLPLHLADAHMKGDIHIHGLAYFATKPYSAVHDFRWLLKKGIRLNSICMEPPRTPEQAMLQAVKVMSASADFYGPQILDFFNVYLAPYIKGLGYEEVKELAKMYLYESQPARNDVRIFIEYGCPEELESKTAVLPGGEAKKGVKYSDFEDESRMLGNAIADAYLEGDYSGNSFTSPTSYYRVRKASEGKEGYESFMITVHKASLHFGTPVFVGSGMPENTLQIVTLNLPRIAYTSGGDESEFYETLDTRLNMVREVLMLKREIMEQ
ncbi:MAG: anaerobic ribonucleoside-triphosphate reductase, partial [Candidatus Hydrothermarchaeaceae archaeon]